MSRIYSIIATVAALAAFGLAGADAAGLIGSDGIANNSLRSIDLEDGKGVGPVDLNANAKAYIDNHAGQDGVDGVDGTNGTDGQDGADGAGIDMTQVDLPLTVVTDVGGTFGKYTQTVRATLAGTVTLQPGTYNLESSTVFYTTTVDAARDVRMQVALRVDDGTDWGQDLGTSFTGLLSPLANREAVADTGELVTVTEETTVEVRLFGYEDDQGAGASGQVAGQTSVRVQRLG